MNKIDKFLAIRLFFIYLIFINTAKVNLCDAEEKISLDLVIKEAKENNPEIKMVHSKYLSTKQRIITVKTLEYPQVGFETSNYEQMYFISQMLPLPGKLSLKGKIVEKESEITEQELNLKIREVVAEVKKSYLNYWLVHKIIDIYRENIDIMKRFLNIAKTHYAVGKVSQTDILKANIELAEMDNMLVILEQERISLQAELNRLLNRADDTPLGKPEQPEIKEIKYTYEELQKISLNKSPELLLKKSLYDRNTAGLNLAKLEWFPDIMAGIKLSNMGNQTYMFQTSLPVYFWKQNSIVNTMKKEKETAEWELQSTKVFISQKIKDLYTKYDAHRKSVEIYKTTILPLAQQTLSITESGYRTGKNNFLDLLDSQKRYLSYNIEYYKHLTETQIYLTELEKIIGIDF